MPEHLQTVEMYYYGAKLGCNIEESSKPCDNIECGICGISKIGLSPNHIMDDEKKKKHFEKAFYFSPSPAKCHEYTEDYLSRRGILLVHILPGKKIYNIGRGPHTSKHLEENEQYDSVYENPRNFAVLSLSNPKLVLPCYIIIYTFKIEV